MADRMGFEGQAFCGTAGSTASTFIEDTRNISSGIQQEYASTKRRSQTGIPKITQKVIALGMEDIEITVLNNDGNSELEFLREAAADGTPVAIRLKDYAAGKGFDGDCGVSFSSPYELDGEQVVTIKCVPTEEAGRPWEGYV